VGELTKGEFWAFVGVVAGAVAVAVYLLFWMMP
jgi:hypothetical protein